MPTSKKYIHTIKLTTIQAFLRSNVTSKMPTLEAFANIYFQQYIQNHIVCFSVINTLLGITAIVGNTVILLALHKETSLYQTSKSLIRNVVVSDPCVGIVELVFFACWVSFLQVRWQTCHVFLSINTIGSAILILVSL